MASAAIVLTEHLTKLSADDRLPLLVVSLGSAGSAQLEQCGLYQASEVSWRDMDASAILEYFAPLQKWLEEQNKGQQCGW